MRRQYSHYSKRLGNHPRFIFKPATTSESTSAADYKFGEIVKPEIFDSHWLQAGPYIGTSEGIFFNPPRDVKGNPIINTHYLKNLLSGVEPIRVNKGGIYIVPNTGILRDFAYAEHGSFITGEQEAGDFVEGGLARALEHTESKRAKNLAKILKSYNRGVNVRRFDPTDKLVSKVVSLGSCRLAVSGRLLVGGLSWRDGYYGFAFGVPDFAAEVDALKK